MKTCFQKRVRRKSMRNRCKQHIFAALIQKMPNYVQRKKVKREI